MEELEPTKIIDINSALKEVAPLIFEDETISAVNISEGGYKALQATYKNCTFTGEFKISSSDIGQGCHFEDCIFEGAVRLTDIVAVSNPKKGLGYGAISFRKCSFEQRVKLTKIKSGKAIDFSGCEFANGLFLHSLFVENDSIYLNKLDVGVVLEIIDSTISEAINIISIISQGECLISNTTCKKLTIESDNNFKDELNITGCKIKEEIDFKDGEFKGTVNLTNNQTEIRGLTIEDSNFHKAVNVNYHTHVDFPSNGLRTFSIQGAKFTNGLNVIGNTKPAKDIPVVFECTITSTAALSGNISFSNLKIHHLNISGYNTNAKISLLNLKVKELTVDNFINEGMVVLSEVRPMNDAPDEGGTSSPSILKIWNSNLGKAQLFQVDFSSFTQVLVSDVILSEISTFKVDWFSSAQLESKEYFYYLRDYLKAKKTGHIEITQMTRAALISWLYSTREIYRQLKFISIKQGDTPLSHKFQALEMDLYKKIMKYQRPRNWDEYIVLFTNQSNNFGQSWKKPLSLLLVFSFLTYIPIGLLTANSLDVRYLATSWSEFTNTFNELFYKQIKLWLVLLNPTHRVSELTSDLPTFWLFFWDILSRIIISYFIFQTISAFRKFNK